MTKVNASRNRSAVSEPPVDAKPLDDWPIEDFDFEFDEDFEPEEDERW